MTNDERRARAIEIAREHWPIGREYDSLTGFNDMAEGDQKRIIAAIMAGMEEARPPQELTSEPTILAVNDETGRMWEGPATKLPDRYREVKSSGKRLRAEASEWSVPISLADAAPTGSKERGELADNAALIAAAARLTDDTQIRDVRPLIMQFVDRIAALRAESAAQQHDITRLYASLTAEVNAAEAERQGWVESYDKEHNLRTRLQVIAEADRRRLDWLDRDDIECQFIGDEFGNPIVRILDRRSGKELAEASTLRDAIDIATSKDG